MDSDDPGKRGGEVPVVRLDVDLDLFDTAVAVCIDFGGSVLQVGRVVKEVEDESVCP